MAHLLVGKQQRGSWMEEEQHLVWALCERRRLPGALGKARSPSGPARLSSGLPVLSVLTESGSVPGKDLFWILSGV